MTTLRNEAEQDITLSLTMQKTNQEKEQKNISIQTGMTSHIDTIVTDQDDIVFIHGGVNFNNELGRVQIKKTANPRLHVNDTVKPEYIITSIALMNNDFLPTIKEKINAIKEKFKENYTIANYYMNIEKDQKTSQITLQPVLYYTQLRDNSTGNRFSAKALLEESEKQK